MQERARETAVARRFRAVAEGAVVSAARLAAREVSTELIEQSSTIATLSAALDAERQTTATLTARVRELEAEARDRGDAAVRP